MHERVRKNCFAVSDIYATPELLHIEPIYLEFYSMNGINIQQGLLKTYLNRQNSCNTINKSIKHRQPHKTPQLHLNEWMKNGMFYFSTKILKIIRLL